MPPYFGVVVGGWGVWFKQFATSFQDDRGGNGANRFSLNDFLSRPVREAATTEAQLRARGPESSVPITLLA